MTATASFVLGLVVGATFGAFVMGLLVMGKIADLELDIIRLREGR